MLLKRSTFFRMLTSGLIVVVVSLASGCQMWERSEPVWDDQSEFSKVAPPGNPPKTVEPSFFSDRANELDRRMSR